MVALLFVCLLLPIVDGVLEQVRDSNNVISWKVGPYRNRNVIPMPTSLDLEKKHRRDTEGEPEEDQDMKVKKQALPRNVEERSDNGEEVTNRAEKKSFIREHFSLPIGADVPLGYNTRIQRKGKKSEISQVPLSAKLADNPHNEFAPALENEASLASRSKVTKTWGMTWEDPHPNPELYRDTSGSERSTLTGLEQGVKKNGKITEKEFDSGLMGRGLGGMTERAQNENLMEQKFEEQMEDEGDVEAENNRPSPRDKVYKVHTPKASWDNKLVK